MSCAIFPPVPPRVGKRETICQKKSCQQPESDSLSPCCFSRLMPHAFCFFSFDHPIRPGERRSLEDGPRLQHSDTRQGYVSVNITEIPQPLPECILEDRDRWVGLTLGSKVRIRGPLCPAAPRFRLSLQEQSNTKLQQGCIGTA